MDGDEAILKPELADSHAWDLVKHQIDGGFGEGVTDKLVGSLLPVTLKHETSRSFYLVPREWMDRYESDFGPFTPQSLGTWIGDLSSGRFTFAISILDRLVDLTKNLIVVSRKGAEALTYGRSILKHSVVETGKDLKRGQYVLVMNENRECLGLAVLSVDTDKLRRLSPKELVAKNVMDVGWYIRRFS
jgi:ribosome biogenesis protein Nip4